MNEFLTAQSTVEVGRGLYLGLCSAGVVLIAAGILMMVIALIRRKKALVRVEYSEPAKPDNTVAKLSVCAFGAYASSLLGDRKNQQDSCRSSGAVGAGADAAAVVCDGMGGLENGEIISSVCADVVYDGITRLKHSADIEQQLKLLIQQAERKTSTLTDSAGKPIKGGTTVVAALIRGDTLYWASAGDSRIYLYRSGTLMQLTKDHNYRLQLMEDYHAGKITLDQVETHPKKEALISFVGGGLRIVDTGRVPFLRDAGDTLILCSDGLYKTMSEWDIKSVVEQYQGREDAMAEALAATAVSKGTVKHDNTTVVVIGGR